MASDTYEFLQEILKSGEVDRWNYPEYVRDVVVSRNPGSTKIIIAFENDDDFLETLGIDDDDKYVWSKFSHNYEPDHHDLERYNDDWKEGYIFDGLDDENKEKINYILKIIDPTLSLENDPDYRGRSKIANVLENKFPTEVDEIIYEFGYQNQLCIGRAVKKELLYETKNPYLRFGIVEKDWGWRFETTVSILLNWYRTLKAEDEDLKGLLTKLIERYQPNTDRGDWYELEYSVWCEDYDKDEFNYQAGKILDKLVEDLIENMTDNENFNEYLKILDVVSDLGGFNKWIPLPDVDRSINFSSIDPETNRLVFWLTPVGGKLKNMEERSVKTVDELYTTMHNPELFEHLKKTIKKIL